LAPFSNMFLINRMNFDNTALIRVWPRGNGGRGKKLEKNKIENGVEEKKMDTCRAMTVEHAAPLSSLVRLTWSSRCVGWAGRLAGWGLGWSSRRLGAGLVVLLYGLALRLLKWALKFNRRVFISHIYTNNGMSK
jgi:hypothetical protein